jgi:phosphoribosylaminoimidazolecarboxamide formyltransferase/IMP cyclohydrolase
VEVRRALISVSDKSGLVPFARSLHEAGVELVSSGGTAAAIDEAGLPVRRVAEVTGAPEILGGRVKTLHPRIHGGILADTAQPDHAAELAEHGIEPFQLVVANLYPFAATLAAGASPPEVIEQIDIGGPAMIRAAAKNHAAVGVVTSPDQYDEVAAAVTAGGLDGELRRRMAREAFFLTAAYDAAIVQWMEQGPPGDALPERIVLPLRLHQELRYGENPHQRGGVYAEPGAGGWWARCHQLQGKPLSFNNLADAEAAWRLAADLVALGPAGVVVVKHTVASGAAVASDLPTAFAGAWAGDPLAAFGGVVAVNRPLDAATAGELAERFVEVIIAPEVPDEAAAVLAARKNLRLLAAPLPGPGLDLRRVDAGILVQARDEISLERSQWKVAGAVTPDPAQWADLALAWLVAAHTKSNAVVIAGGGAALGVGGGDQSRVGAAERAVVRAGERALGAVAASDAFFPFRDGVDVLAAAGVAAIIQPGGSVRDDEVVAAADGHGIAMVMTGRRHFRH